MFTLHTRLRPIPAITPGAADPPGTAVTPGDTAPPGTAVTPGTAIAPGATAPFGAAARPFAPSVADIANESFGTTAATVPAARMLVYPNLPCGIERSGNTLQVRPGLMQLTATPVLVEEWWSPGPVQAGNIGALSWVAGPDILFAAWQQPDEELETSTEQAYVEIFAALRSLGYPHPLRIWNYFSRIHADECGLERYQAFCTGRARALEQLKVDEINMPAATAIGTQTPGLFVYLIAARKPGQPVENPRQVSAYHYPRTYSPDSPAFARATRLDTPTGSQLLLSGTASIVGHQTRHIGDCAAQAREILANLRALQHAAGDGIPALNWLRVYLREAKDRDIVRATLAHHLRPMPTLQWIQGDVCRRDLLVEIEGVHGGTA